MQPVFVLFGTESGNAQGLAKRAGEALVAAGLQTKVIDMMDFAGPDLAKVQTLLVITSTYGNGDPPSNAEALHAYLMKKCPQLPSLRFSVCGLGDTTYERFAQCGKDFDKRLGELGAKRLLDRQDCDIDYEEPFEAWLEGVIGVLAAPARPSAPPAPKATDAEIAAIGASHGPDEPGTRRNPVAARVIANVCLTGEGSTKRVHHLALATAGLPLPFEPGDSIGIWPENDPDVVAAVVNAIGAKPDARVTIEGLDTTLRDALTRRLEIQHPDARLVELVHGHVDAAKKQELVDGSHVLDLLATHKKPIDPATFVGLLRPMAPRLYSVASSPRVVPGEVHLVVDILRYELFGKPRRGVTSGMVESRLAPGGTVPVYLHRAPSFRLAPPDRPIIMIGPGTGIAPFRAFLQERRAAGSRNFSWLFFGARNFATDFLYRQELDGFIADGTLRLDVAFSRDQEEKVYVQHRMRQQGKDLMTWLDHGAVVYVCGDAKHMAPDVHEALIDVLVTHGGRKPEAARAELSAWSTTGRYLRDVY